MQNLFKSFNGRVWTPFRKAYKENDKVKFVVDLALYTGGIYVFTKNVYSPTVCIGPSMLPTIHADGELAFVDIVSYKWCKKSFESGDVITALTDSGKQICKRIRGMEGDIIFNPVSPNRVETIVLQKGQVWLQGDNPANSMDSRMYGPVNVDKLIGKVTTKINHREFCIENLPNEFEYLSIELERNDTKVLRNATYLRDGIYVPCEWVFGSTETNLN